MEVVGAVASISQLAQYTAKLVICLRDLSKNVYRSSEQFRNYQQRTNELQQIISLIKENEALQAQPLNEPIEALLQTIQAIVDVLNSKFIDDPSNKSKKWKNRIKAARILQAESAISERFDELERHKSTLALAILENLGGYVHRIDTRLPQIHEQVQDIQRTLLACTNLPGNNLTPTNYGLDINEEICNDVRFIGTPDESKPALRSSRPINARCAGCYPEKGGGNRTYTDNTALEKALQVNGNIGTDDSSEHSSVSTRWSSNSAAGQSRQVNGDVFDQNFASQFFS